MSKNRFITGNVIRTGYGSIQIVISVRDDGYTNTISIDYTNSSSGHKAETYEVDDWCNCGDCEYCDENKPYKRIIYGMDKAELLASTVKEWIIKSSTSNFGF